MRRAKVPTQVISTRKDVVATINLLRWCCGWLNVVDFGNERVKVREWALQSPLLSNFGLGSLYVRISGDGIDVK